jgi:hypothetical protein
METMQKLSFAARRNVGHPNLGNVHKPLLLPQMWSSHCLCRSACIKPFRCSVSFYPAAADFLLCREYRFSPIDSRSRLFEVQPEQRKKLCWRLEIERIHVQSHGSFVRLCGDSEDAEHMFWGCSENLGWRLLQMQETTELNGQEDTPVRIYPTLRSNVGNPNKLKLKKMNVSPGQSWS